MILVALRGTARGQHRIHPADRPVQRRTQIVRPVAADAQIHRDEPQTRQGRQQHRPVGIGDRASRQLGRVMPDQFIARRQNADPQPGPHAQGRDPQRGGKANLLRPQHCPGPQSHGARRHVLACGAGICPVPGRRTGDGQTVTFDAGMFLQAHRIHPGRQNARPWLTRRRAPHRKRHRTGREIDRAKRIAITIHRRIRPQRMAEPGQRILGQHMACGLPQWQTQGPVDGLYARTQPIKHLIDRRPVHPRRHRRGAAQHLVQPGFAQDEMGQRGNVVRGKDRQPLSRIPLIRGQRPDRRELWRQWCGFGRLPPDLDHRMTGLLEPLDQHPIDTFQPGQKRSSSGSGAPRISRISAQRQGEASSTCRAPASRWR